MLFPYARVLPLHLTILVGALQTNSPTALVFFLMLKTGADLLMHVIEHAGATVR
jgi:hypothetical protein